MRVLVLIGTRPEAVKCFPVVEALKRHGGFEAVVCVSAQHRHILDQTLRLVGLVPDYDLELMRAAPTLTDITCDVLRRFGDVLEKVQPDRVLVQGDTTTAIAGTLSAFYHHIPVGHIEAGLRTRNLLSPWPEEGNRRIISVFADLHFAPTEEARANLIAENVRSEDIHVTGNTAIDALFAITRRLELAGETNPAIEPVISELRAGGKRLVLMTAHRRENWGEGIENVCQIALRLAARGDVHIALPVHPNPNVSRPVHQALAGQSGVSLLEPLDYLAFIDLMRRAHIILTDSGGVQEEAPSLDKPVLVLRDTTERPEGIAAGTARLVGLDPARVIAEAVRLLDDQAEYRIMSQARNPYGDGNAADRIAAIIASAAGKTQRPAARPRQRKAPDDRTVSVPDLAAD